MVLLRIVQRMIDSDDKHFRVRRRGRYDHFFGAGVQMGLTFFFSQKYAGGLDDVALKGRREVFTKKYEMIHRKAKLAGRTQNLNNIKPIRLESFGLTKQI
uniref:Uncharacterized protein n=1 Tax=Romanomermis culicivorax TaxID=13658 RepID=A0A915IVU6_ROMCU